MEKKKVDNLSHEWTSDIVEYLTSYFGLVAIKNYKKLYKLIQEIVDISLEIKSFDSFREFLDFHNDNYHNINDKGVYINLWWPKLAYLLGNTEKIKKDFIDEKFMYEVIDIMDYVIYKRQEEID